MEFLEPAGIDAHLRLVLADDAPIIGATVTAEIRAPGGDKTVVTFLDDGAHGDGSANDGIYGHVHTAFERGAYLAYAEATGVDNTGDPFTRHAVLSFQYPDWDKPDGPEGGFPLPEGNCGCLPGRGDWSAAIFAGETIPHSPLDSIADGAPALGLQIQHQWTNSASFGAFLGHDQFDNETGGADLSFTHLSFEAEYRFANELCPRPAIHAGIGGYWDQDDDSNVGYNVGASLGVCVTDNLSFSLRYDYRNVPEIDVEYSTLMLGLRWRF